MKIFCLGVQGVAGKSLLRTFKDGAGNNPNLCSVGDPLCTLGCATGVLLFYTET
jgi:hypothetical protein